MAERGYRDEPNVEFGEVSLTILNGSHHASRAERIARLTFDYVRELMELPLHQLGADLTIARLEVPPIQVSLDTMDDEAVARAGAEAIYRALQGAQ